MTAWALILLLFASAGDAASHTGGTTGFASVSVHGQTVRYGVLLGIETLPPVGVGKSGAAPGPAPDYDALAAIVARRVAITADGRACAPVPGPVSPPAPGRASVLVVVHYACAAPPRVLALRDDLFEDLGRDYHTLAVIETPSGAQQLAFEPDRREASVTVAEATDGRAEAAGGSLAFLWLGIEHILIGFDHILFLLALILAGGRMLTVLAIVTAFTVAHSLTLALSVLGIVSFPSEIVEPLIALSIVYVAFENLFLGRAVSRRWAVSFLFGLVHGFGFAGALTELGLPARSLALSLLSFNIGVELGQAALIALLVPALLWMRGRGGDRRALPALSAIVLAAGLVLLVERTLFA